MGYRSVRPPYSGGHYFFMLSIKINDEDCTSNLEFYLAKNGFVVIEFDACLGATPTQFILTQNEFKDLVKFINNSIKDNNE